jgi:hypothetical protein
MHEAFKKKLKKNSHALLSRSRKPAEQGTFSLFMHETLSY